MPASGGSADKFGNRYEGLWAIDQFLRIVDGTAESILLEPLPREESQGIEFRVTNSDGTNDYWSVKRQTTKAGWTLAALTEKDGAGRSILGDLFAHMDRDPINRSVFASTLGAGDFEELRSYAVSPELLAGRLERSEKLRDNFSDYLLPLCG